MFSTCSRPAVTCGKSKTAYSSAADGSHKSLPIQNVEQIVLNKGGKITPEAVYALLEHRIPIIYVDFLGHVVGVLGNLPCSLQRSLCQMQYFSQEPQQILLIRSILAVKLENQQSLLKSYAKSKYHDELLKLAKQIARYAKRISQTDDIEVLRGLGRDCDENLLSSRSLHGRHRPLALEWEESTNRPRIR